MACNSAGIGQYGRKLCVPMTDTSFGVVRRWPFYLLLIPLMIYMHLDYFYLYRRRPHRQSLGTEDYRPTWTSSGGTTRNSGVPYRVLGTYSRGYCECSDCWEVSHIPFHTDVPLIFIQILQGTCRRAWTLCHSSLPI